MARTRVQESLTLLFLTATPWPCGRLIWGGGGSGIPSSCNSPVESWRRGRWKGKAVNVLIVDLDENEGFISVDQVKLRDGPR